MSSSVLHPPCEIISQEVGLEPTPTDLSFLAESGIVPDLSRDLATAYERPRDLPYSFPLQGAVRAAGALGCGGCIIRDTCPLGADLSLKQRQQEILTAVAVRIVEISGYDAGELQWQERAREGRTRLPTLEKALQYGMDGAPYWLNLDSARGDITDDGYRLRRKGDIAELGHLTSVPDETPLIEHRLTTVNDEAFMMIDASEYNEPAPANAQRVLQSKLFGRLVERDGVGKAHIFSSDSTTQKVIQTLANGVMLCEIRMAGKNRLYITVNPNEIPARIVVLGSHGGDAKTQQKFLSSVLPRK